MEIKPDLDSVDGAQFWRLTMKEIWCAGFAECREAAQRVKEEDRNILFTEDEEERE